MECQPKEKYIDNDLHSHFCIDELVTSIKDSLDKIESIWSKNDLCCSQIKKDFNELLKSGDYNDFINELEDYAENLEKLYKK